jgi:uncharacterized protein YbjT (DUF2867 family)
MRIVVIGGHGRVGSKIVAKLVEHAHDAVAADLRTGLNTLTGEGLAEALAGADVVIDGSNSPSFEGDAPMEFFKTSTGNILAAEQAAGVGHHVALSIVGADRLPESDYLRAKVAQEDLIKSGPVPYSIIRSAQFFEFVNAIAADATHGDTISVPAAFIQPIAADDVAGAVARTAVGVPVNGVVEIAGPERFRFDELIRHGLRARNDAREVVADPDADYFGTKLAETSLVPGGDVQLGETRFEDWLAASAVRA